MIYGQPYYYHGYNNPVSVNEPIGGDWEMVSSSHKWQKTAAFAARFEVPVAPDGSETLSYRIRVRY